MPVFKSQFISKKLTGWIFEATLIWNPMSAISCTLVFSAVCDMYNHWSAASVQSLVCFVGASWNLARGPYMQMFPYGLSPFSEASRAVQSLWDFHHPLCLSASILNFNRLLTLLFDGLLAPLINTYIHINIYKHIFIHMCVHIYCMYRYLLCGLARRFQREPI